MPKILSFENYISDQTHSLQSHVTEKKGSGYKEEYNKPEGASIQTYVNSQGVFFLETINSLDQLFSIVISVENDESRIKTDIETYKQSIRQLGKISPTEEDINKMWDTAKKLADDMVPKASRAISSNTIIKDLNNKIEELKKKRESGEIKSDSDLSTEIKNAKDQALKDYKTSPELVNLSDYAKASKLFGAAVDKFSQGAKKELERIINLEDESEKKECYEKIVSIISGIVSKDREIKTTVDKASTKFQKEKERARKGSEEGTKVIQSKIKTIGGGSGKEDNLESKIKTQESFDYSEENLKFVVEDFGGFLKNAKEFISGVGSGAKDLVNQTVFGKGEKGELNSTSVLSSAEALKTSVLSIASEIDNVIKFSRQVTGEGESGSAQEKAAEEGGKQMIDFIRQSYEYLFAKDGLESQIKTAPLSSIKKRLDSISDELKKILRPGGVLDKWKNEVMGKKRESVISAGFLAKGKQLAEDATKVLTKIIDRKYAEERVKSKEVGTIVKKAVGFVKGEDKEDVNSGKVSKIKKRGDYKTFPSKPTDKHKDAISEFQKRLSEMKYLKKGYEDGKYDQLTKDAASKAMPHVASITGKTYKLDDNSFETFQQDIGIYVDNKKFIDKTLGKK